MSESTGTLGLVLLLRIEMPDRPGALGHIATAMGKAGVSIDAIEIVERSDDSVVDDFMVELPRDVMPDTLVSICHEIEGARVLWLSRFAESWSLRDVADAIEHMIDDPQRAAETLTHEAPATLHVLWAALITPRPFSIDSATERAPELTAGHLESMGDVTQTHQFEFGDAQLPGWGDTVMALAPLRDGRVLVVGRRGGPRFARAELRRLRYLAALV